MRSIRPALGAKFVRASAANSMGEKLAYFRAIVREFSAEFESETLAVQLRQSYFCLDTFCWLFSP